MITPRLSVVMAAYNRARTVRSAVASALNQTQECLEVIVVDDGSSDNTVDIVESIQDPRVRLVSCSHRGPSAARNAGIAEARGECVGFLDSDDLWLPTYVEHAVGALQTARNPGFAYTDAYVFDGASGRVRRGTSMAAPDPPPADRDMFLLALLKRNFVFTAATVPATVLSEVGGYDEKLAMCEEYDLWLRILIKGYDPAWMGGPLALYRMHHGQYSRQGLTMWRTFAAVLQGLPAEAMPSDEHRRVLLERRRAAEREVQIVAGEAGMASRMRRARNALGRARERAGLTHSWHPTPPAEIVAAFGDLSMIDQLQK